MNIVTWSGEYFSIVSGWNFWFSNNLFLKVILLVLELIVFNWDRKYVLAILVGFSYFHTHKCLNFENVSLFYELGGVFWFHNNSNHTERCTPKALETTIKYMYMI